MARPQKDGFDYFPFDVNFFEDIKIKKIGKRCGMVAQLAVIYIYSLIYKDKGYYLKCDEDTAFFISEKMGISEEDATTIIDEAVNVGLFDSDMYKFHSVLTSKGIQTRYERMRKDCNRNKVSMNKYKVISTDESIDEITLEKIEVISDNVVDNSSYLGENKDYLTDNIDNLGDNDTKKSKSNNTTSNDTTSHNTIPQDIMVSVQKPTKGRKTKATEKFYPPTIEEVEDYIDFKGLKNVDAQMWYAYYEANGWKVGRNKMKSWKASVCYWDRTHLESPYKSTNRQTKAEMEREKGVDAVNNLMARYENEEN